MKKNSVLYAAALAVFGFLPTLYGADFSIYQPSQSDQLEKKDSLVEPQSDKTVVVASGKKYPWPGVTLHGNWNISQDNAIFVTIENLGDEPLNLSCRVDDVNVPKNQNWFQIGRTFAAHEKAVWEVSLPNVKLPDEIMEKLFAMRGGPGGCRIVQSDKPSKASLDFSKTESVWLFTDKHEPAVRFALYSIEVKPSSKNAGRQEVNESASGKPWRTMSADEFFPMIDQFGQFAHEDWPGKIHSEAELKSRIDQEKADWAAHPRPACWDKFGGWAAGPKQEAKGKFYAKKIDGKWWLVDPEGNLFWSHGVDCVTSGNATTPITDREFYFAALPDKTDPAFKPFYGMGNWAPHNYYEGRGAYQTFNFTAYNLFLKYGNDWQQAAGESAHARLASWRMNTIANWSSAEIYSLGGTTYIATLGAGARRIEGSGGYWGKFPDPFDGGFIKSLENSLKNHAQTVNDPFCIGYFINNEMSWGDDTSLSMGALTSPSDQPAKIAFVAWLKNKYQTIDKLNAAWKSDYASWEAVLDSQTGPVKENAIDDLHAFYTVIAEKYFSVIDQYLKQNAPNKLNLGCRFAWTNELAIRAAEPYCDVISFNKYTRSIEDFKLPEGMDKPCIIGEFHFGALDRGMFHTGLVPCKSQADRAEHYENYVKGALNNPYWVGTHWFQYGSQATTGRGDGENYQIGLVDMADTPYKELVEAVRNVGGQMYELRSGKDK